MGIATLGGRPFRIDPTSVDWGYQIKTATIQTIGGKVVQILGTYLTDMTVEGAFGDLGHGGGWREAERFLQHIKTWADSNERNHTSNPMVFTYPPKGWNFRVYPRALTSDQGMAIHHEEAYFSPKFVLVMMIAEDDPGIVKGIQDKFLDRLADGIGWKQTKYNGPTTEEATALFTEAGGKRDKLIEVAEQRLNQAAIDNETAADGSAAAGPGASTTTNQPNRNPRAI